MNVYETKPIVDLIEGNPYVGRGIVVGTTPDGSCLFYHGPQCQQPQSCVCVRR